ncbi:MAG TPA: ABC transporter substrate-binding protein [Gemmatimonadaceae bacterium]|nr:ABC transporter substrate-binding protein [Gemmatimonadaceae bacterium]
MTRLIIGMVAAAVLLAGCIARDRDPRVTIRISGSALGAEGQILTRQLEQFMAGNPDLRVVIQRTPDDATQRHQLFVQWLNARVGHPDILQLDVVWTPEFAAAGWILPLDRYAPDADAFFPAAIEANTWNGELFAIPWFVDVGMLYRRTDLVPDEPRDLAELVAAARRGSSGAGAPRHGFVFQGARYEGLITVFVEILGAHGGRILAEDGRVAVNEPAAVRALEFLRDAIWSDGISPADVLGWHEEETRFAFQNGDAVFMRNWPYAYSLLADEARSRVAGAYAVGPMPAADADLFPDGEPTTALGGAPLAINRWSDHPDEAWRVIAYLTSPERMLERAEAVGQFPPRVALFDEPRLAAALPIPAADARRAIAQAEPRPVTPIWTEMSELLQIELHRALARQATPEASLDAAARRIEALIERTGVGRLEASRDTGTATLLEQRRRAALDARRAP